MRQAPCILLLVERTDQLHGSVHKAVVLARHLGARLELLVCDTEPDEAHDADGRGEGGGEIAGARRSGLPIAEARELLRAVSHLISAPDVPVGGEAVSATSLREGLADKLRRTSVQLVVMSMPQQRALAAVGTPPATAAGAAIAAIDWSVVRSCEAPLLLTRGRPWQPVPRFAASLELAGGRAALRRRLVRITDRLAMRCGARLDYLPAGEGLARLMADGQYDLLALGCPSSSGNRLLAARIAQAVPVGDLLCIGASMGGSAERQAPIAECGARGLG